MSEEKKIKVKEKVVVKKIRASAELKVKENKKTTINDEITFCIENDLLITIALISKRAGVSTHRVRKYCKANFIDLEKLNKSNYKKMLDPKRVKELKKQEKIAEEEERKKAEEKKVAEKLKKSLDKKNIVSSKHKMPIKADSGEKIQMVCKEKKIKLF